MKEENTPALLECTQLCHCKGSKTLIKDINIQCYPGEIHAFVGLNGSGKSTLLRTISHIWKPTYGSVLFKGENIAQWNRKKVSSTISLVPQSPHIAFNYSVQQMLEMGKFCTQGITPISPRKALELVDGTHLKNRLILSLSAGERQRIYIARALVTSAQVLLFDEPTSALDIKHQLQIWQLMNELASRGKLVLVATHDLQATIKFCTHVSLLQRGMLWKTGTPYNTLTPENIEKIFKLSLKDQAMAKSFL